MSSPPPSSNEASQTASQNLDQVMTDSNTSMYAVSTSVPQEDRRVAKTTDSSQLWNVSMSDQSEQPGTASISEPGSSWNNKKWLEEADRMYGQLTDQKWSMKQYGDALMRQMQQHAWMGNDE